MGIFAGNESGPNFLFREQGDGSYTDIAEKVGIADLHENVRGVAVLDANENGGFDLAYGNWEGPHRLFVQHKRGHWRDAAPPAMAAPSRVRTVIAADFNNDGYEELFFNNIDQPNRMFGRKDGVWQELSCGVAMEPHGLGTGAAVGDFNEDGRLELLIAHGETGLQPLSLYQARDEGHGWLRVLPLTQFGAPARGALVTLETGARTQQRVVDAGSGYLCQMEPVAHFGLGQQREVIQVEVRWPDGATLTVEEPEINQLLTVEYPG
jgi:hypothetical protein